MADYHSPTVVQPDIPVAAMTPLERRLLCELFEHEGNDQAVYFFASDNVADTAWIATAELVELLGQDNGMVSRIADVVRAEIAKGDLGEDEFELDFSMIGYDLIFQDIVRRSPGSVIAPDGVAAERQRHPATRACARRSGRQPSGRATA
jgi:hypothetical protein